MSLNLLDNVKYLVTFVTRERFGEGVTLVLRLHVPPERSEGGIVDIADRAFEC